MGKTFNFVHFVIFFILTFHIHCLDNGLAITPPMGWNSWNHYACNINEQIIKSSADLLVSTGLAKKGYTYVNIDDCWQISRDENGKIKIDEEHFPSGIKSIADYVHSLGLQFGIYSDAGFQTCAGRPGSLHHEELDAITYAEWEIDYLKYDNCFIDGTSPKIRYPLMRDALIKTGRKIFFSMCEWGVENPELWASSVGNSWRTTDDIADTWESFISILDRQYGLEKYAGPGGWNDPDMLEVGNGGMTDNEYQAHFALWALLKAPLLIGCNLTKMSDSTLKILSNEEIISINQDSLGKQGRRIFRESKPTGFLEVYAGELSSGVAIILFNRSSFSEHITADFKECGYQLEGGNLKNLYTGENYGYVEHSLGSIVEPHSVIVLKLTPFNTRNTSASNKTHLKGTKRKIASSPLTQK